jgi:integrase
LRYYTKDQYGRYIAEAEKWAAGRSDLRSKGIRLFFEIAYLTGMRKGEINALRWSDLEDGYVWVRRSLTQKLKGQKWVETPPKTPSSTRRLQMPKQLRDDLDAHKKLQMTAPGWNEAFFICGGPEPIPDTTLEKANEAFAKAAELPKITIHEFRHSHASLLCNAGINIKEIARRLGHADVEMTLKTYSHLYPKEEERAVTILDNI